MQRLPRHGRFCDWFISLLNLVWQIPFADEQAIINGKVVPCPLFIHGSQSFVNIIKEMMRRSSHYRITINETLHHPWIIQAFPVSSATAAIAHLKYQK